MGLMVAFLPYGVDAEDVAHPDGSPVDDMHVTTRYYGKNPPEGLADALRSQIVDYAAKTAPFVATITGTGTLGKDEPPANVLHLAAPDGQFDDAYNAFPEPGDDVTKYPEYTPHMTLGYGIPNDHADSVDDTVGIKFDRIAVADDGDWFVAYLDGDSGDQVPSGTPLAKLGAAPAVCPGCGSDSTEIVSEADQGGGYRLRCNDCGNEWDDSTASHDARTAAADLSDSRLGQLLVAYGSAVTNIVDGDMIHDGPTIDGVGVQYPAQPVPDLIREVLRLRDLADHYGATPDVVGRTVLGRCPACGANWHLTDASGAAPDGNGFQVTCPKCGNEWEETDTAHEARTAAAKPKKKGKGKFVLFTKQPKAKTPAFTKKQRDAMVETGEAMSDGSYPIRDAHGEQDLANAVAAIGRAKDRKAVEAHIRKRAKALDLSDKLPPWIRKEVKTAGFHPGWGYPTPGDVHVHFNPRPRTAAADPRMRDHGKHQKCFHGSKATCKTIRWIAAYTAMRERQGYSKQKAAMIANAMQNAWEQGKPWGKPGHKGLIKKRHTV